ncbi:hypothetical protein FA15DRAFT_625622 [Coprinopsis marcescibilis]|uniref:Cytoplasmic tRNA 2-thiolation protein 2 n=1 Tax=Coprinopsis marcescibilis TaxID=230819 RepID=A0A5C3KJL8_COPMA|nr:hypothetical protein FA15DRAFT_625622 [Coprinopsis marcescibilis]
MSTSCGNPAVEEDALMMRKAKFDRSKQCVKCKERQGNIVIRHAVYCKPCFFPLIVARFRKTLEPVVNPKPDGPRKKGLKASGSLVIGFSGGVGSTVLLDLVAKSYFHAPSGDEENAKPRGGSAHPRNLTGKDSSIWKGIPAVCYIELSGVVPGSMDKIEEARKIVEKYSVQEGSFSFDFIPVRIEDAFNEAWWAELEGVDLSTAARSLGIDIADEFIPLSNLPSSSTATSTPLEALQNYLSSLPTQTAKESAIQTLTRMLLLYTAASRNASHLLLGTSLTTLSINLISGISQGSGFSVNEEAYEEWTHQPRSLGAESGGVPSKVRIVRPLRDVGSKECGFWMWWCHLNAVGKKRLASGKQSIVSLARDFIMGLEQDFPSTVSTIARTCAKVTPKQKSDTTCILCERPAQHDAQEWKARISIRSYCDEAFKDSGHPLPPHLNEFPQGKEIAHNGSSLLATKLCYACHTTFTSRSSRGNMTGKGGDHSISNVIPLPTWTLTTVESEILASRKLDRKDMRKQIQDFILDE